MQTTPPYRYGGQDFRSLGAIKDHIKRAIDYYNRVVGREFFDDVLADVLVDRHYVWRHRKVRPTSFQFMANRDGDGRAWGDSLSGYFGGKWGWCRFSYQKALRKKELTLTDDFPRLCHERWKMVWRPRLFRGGSCVVPGCFRDGRDMDHIEPQHKDIIAACWAVMTEEDKREWWHGILFGRGDGSHYTMPEGHLVTELYDRLTQQGQFQCVCAEHHRKETSRRRSGLPSVTSGDGPHEFIHDEIDVDALFA